MPTMSMSVVIAGGLAVNCGVVVTSIRSLPPPAAQPPTALSLLAETIAFASVHVVPSATMVLAWIAPGAESAASTAEDKALKRDRRMRGMAGPSGEASAACAMLAARRRGCDI